MRDCSCLCDEENCAALELEQVCYNEMERESIEYICAAEKELQRQRERIRLLENVLTENGIPIPKEDWPGLCWLVWLAELLYVPQGCRFRAVRCRQLSGRGSLEGRFCIHVAHRDRRGGSKSVCRWLTVAVFCSVL